MQGIMVWDLAVRVFHGGLIVLVLLGWLSGENEQESLHNWVGYALLGLLLFRLLWGLVGSDTARFTSFVRSPAAARDDLKGLLRGRSGHQVGHAPAGGWMVLLLMTVLLVQVISGLFAYDDDMAGPFHPWVSAGLADLLAEYHEINFNLLMLLVVFHVAAVLYHDLRFGEGLIRAMWYGRKAIEAPAPRLRPLWLAGMLLALSVGAVAWLASQAPPQTAWPSVPHEIEDHD